MSDNKKYYISIFIPILLACSGYLYTYKSQQKFNEMQADFDRSNNQVLAQLERVNKQLKYLYGPLYALTKIEESNWATFREKYRPNVEDYWDKKNLPSKKEAESWRIYIKQVDMPRYLLMEKTIIENADLLVGKDMPDILLDLSVHIAGYKEVLARWQVDDYSTNTSYFNYPSEIREYAKTNFHILKQKQTVLLGLSQTVINK